MVDGSIDSAVLARIESEHPEGVSSSATLDILAELGVKFTEATLRKWVQLGLLPRSVRVGRKGKHSGSQGMYPASIIRQILRIKEMMASDLTIEQIQQKVLFVRGDLEELDRSLGRIFPALEAALSQVQSETVSYSIAQEVSAAQTLAQQLVQQLSAIETRLVGGVSLGEHQAAVG